jgi:2,4-dienoyl-CoA reductase-like NADH-dependent reductase (Old Yellow Enzyme family)/thioredoxin reductase
MLPSQPHTNLFRPGSIGRMTLTNRLVMAPMVTQFATDTGAVSQVHRDYLAERARGGVGLIVVEASYVDSLGKAFACQLGIDRDALVPSHVGLTEALHRSGARVALQLHHGGNRADPRFTGSRIVAPSPVAANDVTPDELSTEEIARVVRSFGQAADRARRAGYDAVEIHGAHGYLLHQFLSPATNRRTDAYGGSVENRLRFTLEVIRSVREAVGPDFPILYRMSAEGGYGIEEAVAFAKEWQVAGVDALNVSIGGTAPIGLVSPETSPMSIPQGYLANHAHAIKQAVQVPVIVVGEIREPAVAEEILTQGKADFIALARPLLTDAEWGTKAAQGFDDRIRKCLSCDHCRRGLSQSTPIQCLINPRLGREGWLGDLEPAVAPRKIMVVGSGPAGMETARVAALRGHQVSLYESESSLGGGQLTLAQAPPYKEKLGWFKEHLTQELARLPVEVHLGTTVDAAMVTQEAPEVLVVATGITPLIPDIPGIHADHVIQANDLLGGENVPQDRHVVILGGRQVGCETAEYLVLRGNTVTVVARSPVSQLCAEAPNTYRAALLKRLEKAGVQFIVEHDVREIQQDGVTLLGPGNAERFLSADLVVIARGAVPQRALADQVREKVEEVYVIGDSQEPRTIAEAMYEGTLLGRQI